MQDDIKAQEQAHEAVKNWNGASIHELSEALSRAAVVLGGEAENHVTDEISATVPEKYRGEFYEGREHRDEMNSLDYVDSYTEILAVGQDGLALVLDRVSYEYTGHDAYRTSIMQADDAFSLIDQLRAQHPAEAEQSTGPSDEARAEMRDKFRAAITTDHGRSPGR